MSKPPNILLLMTDQQRYDTIAALTKPREHDPVIKTPALDRLCAQGTAFTRCYTPAPVCVPARAALATGLAPHVANLTDNAAAGDYRPPQSIMQRLAQRGYQTHGVGKMHFVPDNQNLWGFEARDRSEEGHYRPKEDDYTAFLCDHGFDHVDDPHGVRSEFYYLPQPSQLPERLHHTRWVADRSIAFLKGRDAKRPFFLWSSWIKPHPPFELPTPWNKLYRAHEMAPPLRFEGQEEFWTYWNHAQNRYKWRGAGYDPLLMRAMRAAYFGSISYIDAQIGRVLEALGDQLDNTLILFTSDHGELLGDYGCVGKRDMLDAAARVPLIARLPGRFAAGQQCHRPASLLDIFPTCAAVAGDQGPMPSPEGMDLATLAKERPERVVFSQYQERGYGLHMATDGRRKYIHSEPDRKDWSFDLSADPLETRPQPSSTTPHLKAALLARYRRDGCATPLNDAGDDWRDFPRRAIPADADVGLLFQDAPWLQDRIDKELGQDHRREVTVSDSLSHCVLLPPRDVEG